jgi:hypothetical protein
LRLKKGEYVAPSLDQCKGILDANALSFTVAQLLVPL